jgi:hypothetical protein
LVPKFSLGLRSRPIWKRLTKGRGALTKRICLVCATLTRELSKISRSRLFQSRRLKRWGWKAWTRCSRTQTRWSPDILHRHDPSRLTDIIAHDEIIRWGLSDRLLDIAENYLCAPVGYDGINVFFTKADGKEAGTRRWHRDAEDRRMLKIALYLNDVDEDGGPLQVLRRRLRIMIGRSVASSPSCIKHSWKRLWAISTLIETSSPVPGRREH